MANSFVQVPPDSTGKLIDTWTTTVLGYHRQGIVISDPSTDANVVGISSRLRVPIETEQLLDYDTGAGTANLSLVGLALPGAGGPVAGGTATNPIVVSGTVVTGGLTDAQLRATAVPVSAATLPLPTGAATAASQQTDALTDTQLRATAVPVSGTVAVTGVATSANQSTQITAEQAIQAAVEIIDDWDETNRAAVNLVAGQVAITAGAGAVAANTPRTTLASDDPAVVALQIIDDWDETDRAKVNLIAGQVAITAGAGAVAANTPRTTLASDDPAVAVLGAISGAKVITDANGTLQQYLRGLVYLLITAANYPEKAFYGTAQTVINTATDIAAGNFSGAPAASFDNTSDAAVPYAREALAMLEAPDWAAAPVAGTTVDLYGILNNIDGTDDETDAPATTVNGGAHYFGSWIIAGTDALPRRQIKIDLQGATSIDFYIKNSTAQNMNNDGGTSCIVKITPLAYGVAV